MCACRGEYAGLAQRRLAGREQAARSERFTTGHPRNAAVLSQ